MGEPRIDAPRAVDQLAWWVNYGNELRQEIERLRAEVVHVRLAPDLADELRRPGGITIPGPVTISLDDKGILTVVPQSPKGV